MIYGWKAENPVQEAWRVERVRRDIARLRDETRSVNYQSDIPGVQSNEATGSVLLVEDDELVRTLFRRMLERGGFSVVTAINGRDGVERFREHPVDIVITDMMMPVMGGDDLIRRLVLDRPDVRIIAVSGVEYPYLRTALGLGAKATLRKPVQAERLLETVRRVLAA